MLRIAIPVATVLFCWLTARAEVAFVDGPTSSLYGFPLPWHRASEVSSMSTCVDVSALSLDLILYVLICSAGLRSAVLHRRVAQLGPTPLLLAWAAAFVSVGWLCLNLLGDLHFGPLAADHHRVVSYALHLGTGYPN